MVVVPVIHINPCIQDYYSIYYIIPLPDGRDAVIGPQAICPEYQPIVTPLSCHSSKNSILVHLVLARHHAGPDLP